MVERDGVSLHTGIWTADWVGTYEYTEIISSGPLHWYIGEFRMNIENPRGFQYGFTLEEAKEIAEKHRWEMMSAYMVRA